MPLTILMDGLMCHVGDNANEKHDVILVDNAPTKPHLSIAAAYRTDPRLGDIDEKLKKGDVISFAGPDLPAGPATTTAAFRDHVPGLERILHDSDAGNRILDPKVKARDKDQDGSIVYVIYPGGDLTVLNEIGKLVFTKPNGDPDGDMCVADEAVLTSRNTQGVTLTLERRNDNKTETYELIADAEVFITNRVDSRANHFDKYRRLTKAGDMSRAQSGGACDNRAVLATENPECTNSGWP